MDDDSFSLLVFGTIEQNYLMVVAFVPISLTDALRILLIALSFVSTIVYARCTMLR